MMMEIINIQPKLYIDWLLHFKGVVNVVTPLCDWLKFLSLRSCSQPRLIASLSEESRMKMEGADVVELLRRFTE